MLYSNKDLRKLILPLIMEQLLAILVGLADTVMIAGGDVRRFSCGYRKYSDY